MKQLIEKSIIRYIPTIYVELLTATQREYLARFHVNENGKTNFKI
jgi:hypothetical protein